MHCGVIQGIVDDLVLAVKFTVNKDLPLVSNLANCSKLIFDNIANTSWAGFYLTDDKNNLYLGPFQGDTATMYIEYASGVCGTCLADKKTIIVPNVHEFPGHIACSSLSNSEIVVPIIKNEKVVGVIDLDSNLYNNYNEKDAAILEKIALILSELF